MLKHKKSPPASTGGEKAEILLELDLGAGFFQLLLDLFGVVLAGAFLDGLRSEMCIRDSFQTWDPPLREQRPL